MAYSKAEEKKWQKQKAAVEEMLRLLGFSQKDLGLLLHFDWEVFNSDKRFSRGYLTPGTYMEDAAILPSKGEVASVEALQADTENEDLYQIFLSMDKPMLRIAILKSRGYTASRCDKHKPVLRLRNDLRRVETVKSHFTLFSACPSRRGER